MVTGRKCKLIVDGHSYDAETIIATPNLKHLILKFKSALSVGGNVYSGNMPVRFDEGSGTYRDLLTLSPVEIDWLCAKCNQRFQGKQVFTLRGEMGLYVWDVDAAITHVSTRASDESSPNAVAQPVPLALLNSFLEVNSDLDAPEHIDHVDVSFPGIVGQRFGGMFLLDGTYRAHKCKRDGVPFLTYVLTLEESDALLINEMCEQADVTPEVIARELRGVLSNNRALEYVDAEVAVDADPVAAERVVRALLSNDENARLRLHVTRP